MVQIVRETTIAPDDFMVNDRPLRQVQDPATIAWNLCTTAFFKSGGKPWKLADIRPGVCYVGLVFKKDTTDPQAGNACCGAQMFLNSGDGLVFKGAVGNWYSETSKEFHLTKDKAAALMKLVVDEYKRLHGHPPEELFIHGQTRFNQAEWEGFLSVVPETTNLVGVRIREASGLKLYTPGKNAILRGTTYQLCEKSGYLWTKGFTPRLGTYLGSEVPNPIFVEISRGGSNLDQVMKDVLALTKVNFNACIFGDGLPVTLKFAHAVGEILTAAPVDDVPPLPFRHYI